MRNDLGDVVSIIATVVDITERINDQEKILHQAHYDDLTQLPNRFLALDRLGHMIVDAKRYMQKIAVMFLDLDDFKKINDMFGHEVGDKLLKESSLRMMSSVRKGDTVGRLGGDEFIVILNNIESASEVLIVVEKIKQSFNRSFHINNRELLVTISIGIAVYPDEGEDVAGLLSKSDAAMYHAKQQGRNTYAYYNEAMNQDIKRRLEVEEQLVGALQRQEFYVVYQPKINLKTEVLIGAEALLRWDNEVLGQVSPDEFIPVAEQTGLIVSIGLYVLEETIKVIKSCLNSVNEDFKIAVNISPLQFRNVSFVIDVEQALLSGGIDPAQLEFEITEGVLASNLDHVQETINKIDALGIYVAMDDFGTGYSSLSYLRQYPFKILKIDRSFIKEIENNKSDLELVHATIAMSHALNLKVVAEGVETDKQSQLIKQLDCDYAQGYLYSKPLKVEQFLKLLKMSPIS